jgi:hypothetical protein
VPYAYELSVFPTCNRPRYGSIHKDSFMMRMIASLPTGERV